MAYLEAPILRVTGLDTPFPYSLEHEYLPNAERVMGAIRQTLEW
jgi:pyruvate/2-oxoglutarate/acetoin dehydrogenase E1 component